MLKEMQWSSGVCVVLALLLGATAGAVDLTQSEVQPTVLLIVVSTCLLGFVRPRLAWAWALVIGSSILAAHLIASLAGYRPRYPVQPNVFATLIALVPALIGAYFGAAARWILKEV